jgi:hypothetical protein
VALILLASAKSRRDLAAGAVAARHIAAMFYGPLPRGLPPVAQAPGKAEPHPTTHALQRRWAERGPPGPECVFLARGPGLLILIGPICPAPSPGAAPRPADHDASRKRPFEGRGEGKCNRGLIGGDIVGRLGDTGDRRRLCDSAPKPAQSGARAVSGLRTFGHIKRVWGCGEIG